VHEAHTLAKITAETTLLAPFSLYSHSIVIAQLRY